MAKPTKTEDVIQESSEYQGEANAQSHRPTDQPVSQTSSDNAAVTPVIYCGPSLPRAKIITMSVYRGGLPKNIEALIEKIPEIGV